MCVFFLFFFVIMAFPCVAMGWSVIVAFPGEFGLVVQMCFIFYFTTDSHYVQQRKAAVLVENILNYKRNPSVTF